MCEGQQWFIKKKNIALKMVKWKWVRNQMKSKGKLWKSWEITWELLNFFFFFFWKDKAGRNHFKLLHSTWHSYLKLQVHFLTSVKKFFLLSVLSIIDHIKSKTLIPRKRFWFDQCGFNCTESLNWSQLSCKHQCPTSLTLPHSHDALPPVPAEPRGAAEGAEAVTDGAGLKDGSSVC